MSVLLEKLFWIKYCFHSVFVLDFIKFSGMCMYYLSILRHTFQLECQAF